MEKWIDIKEKRPQSEEEVLVTLRENAQTPYGGYASRSVAPAWFVDNPVVDDKWYPTFYAYNDSKFFYDLEDILAWMPLPEPYTAEEV